MAVELGHRVAFGHMFSSSSRSGASRMSSSISASTASSLSPRLYASTSRHAHFRQNLVGLDAQAQNPRWKSGRQTAGCPRRETGFASGNWSGEICDKPLACNTSSRTAPSLTMRKLPAKRVAFSGCKCIASAVCGNAPSGVCICTEMAKESFCGWLNCTINSRSPDPVTGCTFQASTSSPCTRVTSPAPCSLIASRLISPCMILPLMHAELPHQVGADADLRQHFGGVKQFPLGLAAGLFPGEAAPRRPRADS